MSALNRECPGCRALQARIAQLEAAAALLRARESQLAPLPAQPSPEAPPPRRHQVLDLPPVLIETTEYQCCACCCPHCQRLTSAQLPPRCLKASLGPGFRPS